MILYKPLLFFAFVRTTISDFLLNMDDQFGKDRWPGHRQNGFREFNQVLISDLAFTTATFCLVIIATVPMGLTSLIALTILLFVEWFVATTSTRPCNVFSL